MLAKTPHEIYTEEVLTDDSVFADDYVLMFENFALYIINKEAPIATVEDGLNQVRLANAIQLSGWTGREVSLSEDLTEYDRYLAKKMRGEA